MPTDPAGPPLQKNVDLSFEYLGTLPESSGSEWHDNYYNVNDISATSPGVRRVIYSAKSGAAHCIGCNSSRCRHAIKVAEYFHSGPRSAE